MFEICYVIGFILEKQVRGFGQSVSAASRKHFPQSETTIILSYRANPIIVFPTVTLCSKHSTRDKHLILTNGILPVGY